jgi:hypothetical protein
MAVATYTCYLEYFACGSQNFFFVEILFFGSCAEAGYNTSTIALWVVEGEKKEPFDDDSYFWTINLQILCRVDSCF